MVDARVQQATQLMDAFAADTGITSDRPPRRYLWTDAHAVCNWLALARHSGDPRYLDLAIALVAQVHDVLGRHRLDDVRSGWISGLADTEGRRHPTIGGLRIGKPRPERRADEPQDERAEWEQDGQYYHYLTKWMHALYKIGLRTRDPDYQRWAVELALAAHNGFRAQSGPPRLFWKMSIDLSYPLVASSGHHDPLDGLTSCLVLRGERAHPELDAVITDLGNLCRGRNWLTDDALGIGGLLFDAGRLVQLRQTSPDPAIAELAREVLEAAAAGLPLFMRADALQLPAAYRLAFRELGMSIGLQVFELIRACDPPRNTSQALEQLRPYLGLPQTIEHFWLEAENQTASAWTDHEDINRVMLATSLTAPDFLSVR